MGEELVGDVELVDADAVLAQDNAGMMVLFGGANNGTDLNDTWTWNSTAWTKQSPAISLAPRHSA